MKNGTSVLQLVTQYLNQKQNLMNQRNGLDLDLTLILKNEKET